MGSKHQTPLLKTVYCVFQLYSVLIQAKRLIKKTPLMRSMEALSNSAVRVLHLIGETDVNRVITTVGPEQGVFFNRPKGSFKEKKILHIRAELCSELRLQKDRSLTTIILEWLREEFQSI